MESLFAISTALVGVALSAGTAGLAMRLVFSALEALRRRLA